MSGIVFTIIPSTNEDPSEERRELPERLQRMLKEKREARKNWQRFRAQSLKTIYNQLESKLRKELAEFRASPEAWAKAHRQRLPETKYPRHVFVENPSRYARREIDLTYLGRTVSRDEIRFNPSSESEYRSVISLMERIKEKDPDFKYYEEQSTIAAPATNPSSVTSNAKYPNILVNQFPNRMKHLKEIESALGKMPLYEAYGDHGLRFRPRDGPEYHAVVGYLKGIEAAEPELKYFICPLKVGIRGLPDGAKMESIKAACAELGYQVNHVRQTGRTYFVKLFGGEDNTNILEVTNLLGISKIKVELWRGKALEETRNTSQNAAAKKTDRDMAVTRVEAAVETLRTCMEELGTSIGEAIAAALTGVVPK